MAPLRAALAALALLLPTASPIEFFLSPSGSDSADGLTPATAFASLQRAQTALRAALASGPLSADAFATLAPGEYFESAPLLFDARDSGSGGFAVRWRAAAGGAAPVVYSGVRVPPALWQPWSGHIFVANISALLTPPAPPPPPVPGCGVIDRGFDYSGNDIRELLVEADNLTACCNACSSEAGCAAWSMCVKITCGTPAKPINCYLKTSAAGRAPFGPNRVSGTLAPPPAPRWRFSSLLEGAAAAVIARTPQRGSGYLDSLGVSNSDDSFSWPAGVLPASFAVDNAAVFCNIGADWFTETRPALSVDLAARTLHFEAGRNAIGGCNGKIYLQGPRELIDEPGEFALEPDTGLLYYWPLDASFAAPIVAATTPVVFNFAGASSTAPVHDVTLEGLELRGSDFTPDGAYRIFPSGRPNDTPAPTNTGMVRIENATRIALLGCKLLHAGLSAVWIAGASTNVTVEGCWIEGAGFCGVATAGPYPGDAPYASAADAYANFGHLISSNLLYDLGIRVGHGAGVWLFQTGDTAILSNYIKEVPRNGVGLCGIRYGGGAGFGEGVLPSSLYNTPLDFFSALDVLTTRRNVVAYNLIENVVRDTCDSGAFELWGVGVDNTIHTNGVSDLDSGGVDGSWMNMLFADDASHWLNMSSNVLFHVRGKGSEEATMQKSIFSVFENNVIAYSVLGHLANLQPYVEPAAAMTFSRNIFACTATADGTKMDLSVNAFTYANLSTSCNSFPSLLAAYNFSATTTPSSSTPVILELDYNVYYNASYNVSALAPFDSHSLDADPQFVSAASTPPWRRTVADFALAPSSPAFSLPGFRRIETERIGLGAAFAWDLAAWARRGVGGAKIQAESYDRQQGLWREGSYAISGGAGRWSFDEGAWALYRRVDLAGATTLQLRVAPLVANRSITLAIGDPSSSIASWTAAAGDALSTLVTYNVSLAAPLTVTGADLFILPSGGCIIDWVRFV